MPSNRTHAKISKILIGKECRKTNKIMDYPVRFLGKGHRILFHDVLSAASIGYISDGYDGVYSGILHLGVDAVCSKYPAIKKMLEYFV